MKIILISILNLAIQAVIILVSISIAAKYLNSLDLKDWSLGLSSYGYISLFDFGASTFIMRNLASSDRYLKKKGLDLSKSISFIAFIISLILLILSMVTSNRLIFVMGAMFFRVCVNVVNAVFVAEGKLLQERISKIIFSTSLLLSQYFLFSIGFGFTSLPISIYFSVLIQIIYLFFCGNSLANIVLNGKFSVLLIWKNKKEHINWLFYTIPALFIFNFQVFAIGIWSSPQNVVYFSCAHQILYGVISISTITSYLSGPIISRFHGSFRRKRNIIIMTNLRIVVLTSSIVLASTISFLPYIQQLLFSNIDIIPFIILWIIYAGFIIIEIFQMAVVNALIYTGYTNFGVVNIASATINVILCYLLIPNFGLKGALISIIFAQMSTCNIFNILKAQRILELSPKKLILIILEGLLIFLIIIMISQYAKNYGISIIYTCIFLAIFSTIYVYKLFKPISLIIREYKKISINVY